MARFALIAEENVLLNLDPKLQSVVLEHRGRAISGFSFLTGTAVSVVARVTSTPVDHMTISSSVTDPASGHFIVAADVETAFVEAVRLDPKVVSLKLANPLDEASIGSVIDSPRSFSTSSAASGSSGKGVIVGLVDSNGIDAVHSNFRNADGSTRLLAVWDQNGTGGTTPQPYNYGREHTASAINAALAACPLGQPLCASYAETAVNHDSHGTNVADVAAGNGGMSPGGTGSPGQAPEADLIFVNLAYDGSAHRTAPTWRRVIDGVHYIFAQAARTGQQAVVNLSLQALGGPHDDRSLIARALNGFVAGDGKAIVLAESDMRSALLHAAGTVPPSGTVSVNFTLGGTGPGTADIEIWYPNGTELSVTLTSNDGQTLGPVSLASTQSLQDNGVLVGRIHHRKNDPNTGDNVIEILMGSSVSGTWRADLTYRSGGAIGFHAWIGDGGAVFMPPVTTSSTVNGMDASGVITVGAYKSFNPASAADFSGEGPMRDGGRKPDLLAPGLGIVTATAKSPTATVHNGTSIAAPYVTGIVARMMQAAGRRLTAAEIRDALIAHASGGGAWDPRNGFGIVAADASIMAVAPAIA